MQLHRAEIAVQAHQITEPLRVVREKIGLLTGHPLGRLVAVSGVGFLYFSRGLIGRVSGVVLPVLFPQIRNFVANQAMSLIFRGLKMLRARG